MSKGLPDSAAGAGIEYVGLGAGIVGDGGWCENGSDRWSGCLCFGDDEEVVVLPEDWLYDALIVLGDGW